jgi:hypothetical protein
MTEEPTSPAAKRFRELVQQQRDFLPRKQRSDWRSIYAAANLRQVLEQLSAELSAGISHDIAEVQAFVAFANEAAEAKKREKARSKQRFRGLGH